MELDQTLNGYLRGLVRIATQGEYVVPFWAAVLFFLLLVYRRASLKLIWRKLHWFEDSRLQTELIGRIDAPLQFLLILLAVCPFAKLLPQSFAVSAEKMCVFIASFLAVHVVVISIDLMVFGWYLGDRKDANVPSVFRFVVLTVVYLGLGMLLLNATLGINVMPVIATSTVLTAVLGLALQDTLRNLFAGLTMTFEKRFKQGDWISFGGDAATGTVGQVVEIGWRTTKLRTSDETFAVIPNSQFTNNKLVNYSAPSPVHALYVDIPLSLRVDLETAKMKVSAAIAASPEIASKPLPELFPVAVKTDHILTRLRFWVKDFGRRDQITGMVIEIAHKTLSELGALPGSAFPAAPALPPDKTRAKDDQKQEEISSDKIRQTRKKS